MSDRGAVESRVERFVSYLGHNREQIVVDVVLLTAWVLVATELFRWQGLPRWLLYLVLFVGIAIYVHVTPEWERPYQSPE